MESINDAVENLDLNSGQSTPIAATTNNDHHSDNEPNTAYDSQSDAQSDSQCDAQWYYIQVRDTADYRVVELFGRDGDPDDEILYTGWNDHVWAVISYCDHHAEEHLEPLRRYGFKIHSARDLHRLGMVEVDNDDDFRLVGEVEQCRNCASKGVYAPLVDCRDHHSAEKSD